MKSNKLFLLFLLIPFSLAAQDYLFPVKPGQRNLLAGNFSEIRPNHFHSGIDVKIGGVDGEPILSIADGYVYRVKLSTYGYGNVVYIKHPNGQSSVYAHLRNFSPKIHQYVKQEIYKAEKNEIELFPDAGLIPVKRGEIIGNGGNTGSSGGPHLHFEIRDSLDRAIDPFQFRFREIIDNTAPVLFRVALRPLNLDSRVNGKFQRQEFTPVLEGNRYVLKTPVKISGKVGLEVYAIDRMDDVSNIFGVPVYELLEDQKPAFRIDINHVDFEKGRFFLTHTYQNRFTRLYLHPNNPMQIYQPDTLKSGAIGALPGEKKQLRVLMKDYFGNTKTLEFQVEGEEAPLFLGTQTTGSKRLASLRYEREVMVIEAGPSYFGSVAKVFVNGFEMDLPPAYTADGIRTYLWDMNYGIPDSLDVCTELIYPKVSKKIPFREELFFTNQDLDIQFWENTLLDDLFLRVEKKDYALTINSPSEYLQSNMEVVWKKPNYSGDPKYTHVYFQAANGPKTFVGGTWESEDIRFKTRNFGTFVLDEDRVPPSIQPTRVNSDEIRFVIKDDKSGIQDFEAWVDGKWVLMRYEHKQNLIWSEKLDKQPFKGEVLLKVRDMAGNESRYSTTLK
ncbi:M23 family metallopeptidase [Cecembia calidifontis]|uniref:Peptidase M23-like protein n=1 Tax=Cecembia calidifontis TaxID=1187080 RepID=A0A4V2F6S6_9BACT|nr:M23 family metallopeptidase [Cecembia calidifontis]RZS97349.1 peptidase M23-like protein [Cecembia calidifontis]